jgi:hypothetical protein
MLLQVTCNIGIALGHTQLIGSSIPMLISIEYTQVVKGLFAYPV